MDGTLKYLTSVVLALGLLLCDGIILSAQEADQSAGTTSSIKFRRVFVPVDKEEYWPLDEFEYGISIRLDQFEQMLEAVNANNQETPQTMKFQRIEYQGLFEDGIVQGKCNFHSIISEAVQNFLPLGSTNINLESDPQADTEKGQTTVGSLRDSTKVQAGINLNIDPSDDNQVAILLWSFPFAEITPGVWSGKLRLPKAGISDVHLHTPSGYTLETIQGILLSSEAIDTDAAGIWHQTDWHQTDWHLAPSGNGILEIQISENNQESEINSLAAIQADEYTISASEITIASQLLFHGKIETSQEVQISTAPSLIISQVLMNDRPIEFNFAKDPITDQGKISFDLPDSQPEGKTKVTIQSVASISSSKKQKLMLPRLYLSKNLWESGTIEVNLSNAFELHRAVPTLAKLTDYLPSNGAKSKRLRFDLFETNAQVALQLEPLKVQNQLLMGTTLVVSENDFQAQVKARLATKLGDSFNVDFIVAKDWQVNSVQLENEESLLDWEFSTTRKKLNHLRVRFAKPFSAITTPVLKINLSRPHASFPGYYSLRSIMPLTPAPGSLHESWFAIKGQSPLVLQTDPHSFPFQINSTTLPDSVQQLLKFDAETAITQLSALTQEDYHFRAIRQNKSTATISSNYSALPEQFKQDFYVELSDNDAAADYVEIQTDRPLPEGTQWFINDKRIVMPNLLSEDELKQNGYPSNSVISRIPLPISISVPLTLKASFEGSEQSLSTPYLLSIPKANTQTCTIKISTPENSIVTSNRRGIQQIYTRTFRESAATQTPYPIKVDTFTYLPSELTRINANTPEFFKIIWIDDPLISSLFVKQATHQTKLFNSGVATHQTRYELISNQGGNLQVTFPPEMEYLFSEVNGINVDSRITKDRLVIELPSQPGHVEVVLHYQSQFHPGVLFSNYQANYPQVDLPVGTSSHQIQGIPNHSTIPSLEKQQPNLALHLCQMLLGDRLVDKAGSVFEQNSMEESIFCPPGQTLRFWNLPTIHAIGYALLFLSALSMLALRKRALLIGILFLVTLILFASYLPIPFYPILSNLFQGTILGMLILLLSNQGWLYFGLNQESDHTPTNSLSKSTILLILFSISALTNPVNAQDTRPLTEAKSPLYPVLIPVNEEEQAAGDVYLPASLHKLLLELTSKPQSDSSLWTLHSSLYDFQVSESNSLDNLAEMNFIANYQVETNRPDQTVIIPLNESALQIATVIVDKALIPVQWNPVMQKLEVPLSGIGIHHITVTAKVSDVDLSQNGSIELSVAACPNTKVSFSPGRASSQFSVNFEGKTLPLSNTSTIPLGSINSIEISWDTNPNNPDVDYTHIDLLSITRGEVSLQSQFSIHNQGEPIQSIALWIDSRLRPLDTLNPTERVQVGEVAGERTLLQVDFTEPILDSRKIELQFIVDDASGIGNLRYPIIHLEDATRRQHLIGFSAPSDFSIASSISEQLQVTQETFAHSWEKPVPNFREAFALPVTLDSQYAIQSHPITHKATAETTHQITLHNNRIDLECSADITIQQGSMPEYTLKLESDFIVDAVYVSEDGLQQSVEWAQSSTTGEVSIRLLQPATHQQQLSIKAHAKSNWPSEFQFTPVSFDGIQVIDTQVSLFRNPNVSVERIEALGLVDNGEFVAPEVINPQKIQLSTYHSTDEPCTDDACSIQIQAKQNNVTLSGELRTIVGKIDQKWSARIDCELEQHEGRFDSLQFYLPNNLVLDTDSVVGYQVTSQPMPLAGGILWTFTPIHPVATKFRLSFIAQLNTETGSRIEFSSVHLIGQPQLTRLVAIPSSVEDREALWITGSLQQLAVSARWYSSRIIPQSFQIYQATRPFVCRLTNRRSIIKQPRILLQDAAMQIDNQGNYYRVTNYHLVPNGSAGISFSKPLTEQLLHAYCDEQSVAVNRLSESEIYLAFSSRHLTQTVTLVTTGQLKDVSKNIQQNMITPLNTQVTESTWSVSAPDNIHVQFGREKTIDSFSSTKVEILNQAADFIAEGYALISATELEQWSEVRKSFLSQAIYQWRSNSRLSKEEYQNQIESALHGSASNLLLISQQSLEQNNLSVLESLFSQTNTSDSTTRYFTTGSTDHLMVLSQPTTTVAIPNWQLAIVWLGSLSMLGLTVFVVRNQEHLQLVLDWVSRFPHILGFSAGILWWLFLSPSFIGLILIAIIICAAIPPWDVSSLIGFKPKTHSARRTR